MRFDATGMSEAEVVKQSKERWWGLERRHMICGAAGMSDKGALGLGTLGFQEPVARKMAADAGFTRFEVSPAVQLVVFARGHPLR